MNNPDQVAFGQLGSEYVTGTEAADAATIPDGKVIVAVTAITAINMHADTASESGFDHPATCPEGVTFFGRMTAFRLGAASEKALVYFG